ncbi:MAG: Extracellular solute-binding protein family 1 [Candidatus Magnetoglobus multicellularis str. Araruama]|uniref:Extracellular solute-binding protein family 1 n=1 Tax=Candidatus Magnetoglobus multicellularis str. Araruama TaxID=890399 RepID=A0A1V1NW72_9BACT|nr:MAG: Extracellular solute-binding protein family 1 [Candidatus Magnetoglobus multicellularis str. Araruama]
MIDGVSVKPLGIPGKNDWNVVHNLAPWIWSAGGEFLTADRKQSALNSDEAVTGLDFYVGLVRQGFVPTDCLEQNSAQISTGFDNGHYAVVFDGPYKLRSLTTPAQKGGALETIAAKKFGILPYPKGPRGRYTFIGGSNLAVFSASKKKEAAWQVIKYLISVEAQIEYSKLSGFLPANKEAFSDPYFTKDINRKVYVEAVQYGRAYPAIPVWGLLEPAMMKRFGIMWDHLLETMKK